MWATCGERGVTKGSRVIIISYVNYRDNVKVMSGHVDDEIEERLGGCNSGDMLADTYTLSHGCKLATKHTVFQVVQYRFVKWRWRWRWNSGVRRVGQSRVKACH